MKGQVLTFGELLLRICMDPDEKWLTDHHVPCWVGGAELNVASALALWGVPVRYLTALPANDLGDQIRSYLQKKGIDTGSVIRSEGRLGLYFLSEGKDVKHSAAIFDRADTAFSRLQNGMVNWDAVLDGISWLHVSAIVPGISEPLAELCLQAVQAAAERQIRISFDLNFRASLWGYGKDPIAVIPPIAAFCHVIMGNIWSSNRMLGTYLDENLESGTDKLDLICHAAQTSEEILARNPRCEMVANTFRFDHQDGIRYFTTMSARGKDIMVSREFRGNRVADKVGSGDSFMAGIIYGSMSGLSPRESLDFATAAAFMKFYIPGDSTTATVSEIASGHQRYLHHEEGESIQNHH